MSCLPVNGGTGTVSGTLAMGRAFLGDANYGGNGAAAGTGVLNINGGTLNTGTISGGSFANVAGGFALFNVGGTGALNATNLTVGDGAYSSILNLYGTTAAVTVSTTFNMANNAANFGITNLGAVANGDGLGAAGGGGALVVNSVARAGGAGTAIFNFHGGTLRVRTASAAFMTGLNNAFVYSEGADVDTNGLTATISQALLAPTGQGVTTISGLGGSGYIDTPLVTLSAPPAGGTLATARAVIDYTTGALTGIVVTNPGTGYTSQPTVTLSGGGGTPTGTATVNLASNTSGGLTKVGLGTLTLSAGSNANTYTGATTVTQGTLRAGCCQ